MFDIQKLHRAHLAFIQEQPKILDLGTAQILREAVRLAQGQNAIKDRTGKLRAGWMWKLSATRDGTKGTLFNRVPYALYQEKGTGLYGPKASKYKIVPRNGKCLRFRNRDGHIVFRRSVMHPGVKPRWIGRASMFGHAAPFLGIDILNGKRIFERWMNQAARRF